ncbi:hypothetical protein C4577_03535 [Candidatus Parcubacteria bacterium]|nr:MAG: hypothetical protein C4577_03535 [Candidatus Parcubacteria bacterium]
MINDCVECNEVGYSIGNVFVHLSSTMMFGNYGLGNISISSSDDEKLKVEDIKKLSPKSGDLLVFKFKDRVEGLYEKLRNHLDDWGFKDIHFVIMIEGNDVSCLDEGEMEKFGWIRKRENRGFEFL